MPSQGGRHPVAQLVQSTVQWGEHRPVPVFDAPAFAGGRAYDHPRGGRAAAAWREPGRGGRLRAMRPGERARGAVLLDEDTIAVRLGKKQAGRELDGRLWEQFPPGPRGLPLGQPDPQPEAAVIGA